MAVLPTPGSPMSTALFLVRRQSTCWTLELVLTPDQRIELILHRRFGQIAAEFRQERRFLDAGERGLLVQELDDVLANRMEPHPLFHKDGRSHRPFLAQDAQEQVLGADVVVQEPIGFQPQTAALASSRR